MYNYTIILIIKFKSIFTNSQPFRISADAKPKQAKKLVISQNLHFVRKCKNLLRAGFMTGAGFTL